MPDHDDEHAPCQVFAEEGWWCYGCARGGSVYDLASALAGEPLGRALRDDAFRRARELVTTVARSQLPANRPKGHIR